MLENLASALAEALQDEYKARATYRAILDRFGAVRPFTNILASEERHIRALLAIYQRYGLPIPEDHWAAQVRVPDTLTQACEEGVQAEIENGAMYERLLAMTTAYPDVQRVFRQLQRASQENHLRAFQRCASRAGDRPLPPGRSHRRDRSWDQAEVTPCAASPSGRRRHRHRRGGCNGLKPVT